MENPFKYGEIVKGECFADREKEIKDILKDLRSGQNIFIYSPRRYGKTSLIVKVLEILRKEGFLALYLDLYQISSKKDFLELYAREISKATSGKLEQIKKFVREYLPGFIPKIVIKSEGTPDFEFDYVSTKRDIERTLLEIYDLPQKIAGKRKRRCVVVFDEFQEIRALDGTRIEKELRSKIQFHDRVSYCFIGSKRGILLDMFTSKKSAFYNIGKLIRLKKIPPKEMSQFIMESFKKTGFTMKENEVKEIIQLTSNHPYYVQMLCHELWDSQEGKEVTNEDIKKAILSILSNQQELYFTLWDALSLQQRKVLAALVKTGGENVYSKDFILDNDLGSVSTVQRSVTTLLKKEIIEKQSGAYLITDVFFVEWIKQRALSIR